MSFDLSKYATGLKVPDLEVQKVYDSQEDYQANEKFNQTMTELHRDYAAKEKLSGISAKKLVLTE